MTKPRSSSLAPLALAGAVAAISFAAIFFKAAQPTHPLVMSGMRLGMASLLMSPWAFYGLRRGRLTPAHFKWASLAGALYALHFGAWVWSLTLTSVAASVTLVTVTPLVLAVVSIFTGKDRPSRRIAASLALAAVGVGLIGWADLSMSAQALIGDALAFIGALAMAGYFVLVRRLGAELDVLGFAALTTGFGALWLMLLSWLMGVPWQLASFHSWAYLLLATLIPQLIGHNLLTWSLRHVTPTTAGIATLAEPVGSTLLGLMLLGVGATPLVYLGCAITLGAVLLAIWFGAPRSAAAQQGALE